ncbi:MAG: DUF4153 domain-containing protein, partial [Luteibaculum sp.]
MKQSTQKFIYLALTAVAGASLFYEQNLGLNVLLFTLIQGIGLRVCYPHYSVKYLLQLMAFPLALSSFLLFYPQVLSMFVWIIAIFFMWCKAGQALRFILLPFHGLLSQILSPVHTLIDFLWLGKNSGEKPLSKELLGTKTKIFALSFGIIALFSVLYISSNALLSKLIGEIDLSFLSWGWIIIAVFIFCFLYGLVFFMPNRWIASFNDCSASITKTDDAEKEHSIYQIGLITIGVLASLITIINLVDFSVLATQILPEGLSYSDYVHQGFYTLIFSMILAVVLILYVFKSQVNFHPKAKRLKQIAQYWIAQNVLLALITGYKNYWYVENYGLTYLRIAVFFALACCLIALFLATRKISNNESNWLYVNLLGKNTQIALFCLALLPNDYIITHYNLDYAAKKDLTYLSSLDHPDVLKIRAYNLENYGRPWADGTGVLQRTVNKYN